MTEIKKRFELTSYEAECFKPTIYGDYLTIAVGFLDCDDDENIDLELFRIKSIEAAKFLQHRHPFLHSHLEFEGEKISILVDDEQPEKINLEFVDLNDEPSKEDLIKKCAEFNAMISTYTNKELLWRAQLISYIESSKLKHIINLALSIVITDGLNITTLTVEFVNILNALLTNKVCREMKEKLEPCESMNYYFDKYELYNEESRKYVEEMRRQDKVGFKLNEMFNSNEERGFYLDLFKLDADLSSKILCKTKLRKVRLTAYFYTTIYYTMKHLYDELGLDFPKRIPVQIAMNLRMRFEPRIPLSACRFFVTFSDEPTSSSFGEFTDFWRDCEYLQTIVEKCSSSETGAIFAYIYYSSLDNQSDAVENSHIECDLGLSNLGAFVSDSIDVFPGPIRINEIYCSDALQAYPNVGIVVQVHVFYWKGELMIQFGANRAYFATKYCKRFVELFKATINDYIC